MQSMSNMQYICGICNLNIIWEHILTCWSPSKLTTNERVWCHDWSPYTTSRVCFVLAIKNSSKSLQQSWYSQCPCWIAFIALSRQFASVWIVCGHPSHRRPALCFHSLIFMNVQAALCSCGILSASCNSHSIWDTKFNACQRTICQHRANAPMGHCACLWAGCYVTECYITASSWYIACYIAVLHDMCSSGMSRLPLVT